MLYIQCLIKSSLSVGIGRVIAFNTELSCKYSIPEHELQEESRDLEEEQETAGMSEHIYYYTLMANQWCCGVSKAIDYAIIFHNFNYC